MNDTEAPLPASLWDALIRRYGTPCAQAREELMRARTACEVVRMLAPPTMPPAPLPVAGHTAAGAPSPLPAERALPFSVADGLLRSLGAAVVEAIHRQALAGLHQAAPQEFEPLLCWHRRRNLDPCRGVYPELHSDFEMKLQRIACTRWLLEMRQETQALH